MEGNTKKYFKYCLVPFCRSTTVKTPNKIFIRLPTEVNRRIKWIKACRRDIRDISPTSHGIFVCEDHFNAAPTPTDPYAEDMKNRNLIALKCIEQVKIDREIVQSTIKDPDSLPSDPKYKEFLTCSYKKQNFQSENGQMLYDNINSFLTRFYDREVLNVLDNCKSITAENDGEMAYNSLKCILKGLRTIEKPGRL